MASVIKAGNATDGVQVTSDNTGILELKTGTGAGTTAVTIGTNQAVTFAGAVTLSGNQTVTGNLTVDGNTTLGNANTDTILMTAAPSIGGAGLGMGFGFRNRIINGAMVIDQRNAGASVTITNTTNVTYTLDRFFGYGSQASKISIQQNAGSVTPPVGFSNYLGVTSLAATTVGASEYYEIGQRIEGFNAADFAWGTANAQTVTLSFWVRSSLTGTFGGAIRNSASTRSYAFSYTVSSANTWTLVSVTIPGDTSGTWLTTSGIGLIVSFGLGAGSSLTGAAGSWAGVTYIQPTGSVSVVGTNGATFYITGVQLEKGSTATSFDYRPYGTELMLCQRYYWRSSTTISGFAHVGMGIGGSTTVADLQVRFPVPMRVSPATLDASGMALGDGTNAYVVTGFGLIQQGQYAANVQCTVASGLVQYRPYFLVNNSNSTGYVGFSAEL